MGTVKANQRTQYEISVDGVPRTYRDRQDIALQTARFLKSRNPHSVVKLKDLQTGLCGEWCIGRSTRPAPVPSHCAGSGCCTHLASQGACRPRTRQQRWTKPKSSSETSWKLKGVGGDGRDRMRRDRPPG